MAPLFRALPELIALRMVFRAAKGSTVQVRLTRMDVSYQAGDGSEPEPAPHIRATTEPGPGEGESPGTDFETFVRETYHGSMRIARSTPDHTIHDAEDAVHEAYSHLQQNWDKYAGKPPSQLKVILRTSIRHRFIDQYRTQRSAKNTDMRFLFHLERLQENDDGPDDDMARFLRSCLRHCLVMCMASGLG